MARTILVVSVLTLLSSGGCLVANPAFDGSDPDNGTTTSLTTSTAPATATATTDAPTTDATDTDAESTVAVDASSSDAGTSTSGDLDSDTEAPASTGEGEAALVLEASKTYPPKAKWYPAVLELDVATAVLLPPTMMVTVGNAGNHKATLTLTLADLTEVQCTYTGGGSQKHPKPDDPSEWEKGLSYLFSACDDGAVAGDLRTVVKVELNVKNGASMQPPKHPRTTVLAVLPKA